MKLWQRLEKWQKNKEIRLFSIIHTVKNTENLESLVSTAECSRQT